jgi:hypothetical protein
MLCGLKWSSKFIPARAKSVALIETPQNCGPRVSGSTRMTRFLEEEVGSSSHSVHYGISRVPFASL